MESNLSDTNILSICIIRNNNKRGHICMSITICMTEMEVFCSLLNPLKCFDLSKCLKVMHQQNEHICSLYLVSFMV